MAILWCWVMAQKLLGNSGVEGLALRAEFENPAETGANFH
jgi:hypothetical protein